MLALLMLLRLWILDCKECVSQIKTTLRRWASMISGVCFAGSIIVVWLSRFAGKILLNLLVALVLFKTWCNCLLVLQYLGCDHCRVVVAGHWMR